MSSRVAMMLTMPSFGVDKEHLFHHGGPTIPSCRAQDTCGQWRCRRGTVDIIQNQGKKEQCCRVIVLVVDAQDLWRVFLLPPPFLCSHFFFFFFINFTFPSIDCVIGCPRFQNFHGSSRTGCLVECRRR